MLTMWHTHGSAPWSTHLSRQVLAQWEHSEQENELSILLYMKKYGGGRGSRVFICLSGVCFVLVGIECTQRCYTIINMNMGEEGDWVTNVATVLFRRSMRVKPETS